MSSFSPPNPLRISLSHPCFFCCGRVAPKAVVHCQIANGGSVRVSFIAWGIFAAPGPNGSSLRRIAVLKIMHTQQNLRCVRLQRENQIHRMGARRVWLLSKILNSKTCEHLQEVNNRPSLKAHTMPQTCSQDRSTTPPARARHHLPSG